MRLRRNPIMALILAALSGCLAPLPDFVTCQEYDACGTTTWGTSGGPQTSGEGLHTVTGDGDGDDGSGNSSQAGDVSGEVAGSSTTDAPEPLPEIDPPVVTPDYTDENALLGVSATAQHADRVVMQVDGGEQIELEEVAPGEFAGEIPAFTGFDNGKHIASLTPWRGDLAGETVEVDYVIALPPPGYERYWQAGGVNGHVAAVDVLPDGRPVEFGTFDEMGLSRCFLRLREKDGTPIEYVPVLPTSECRAIDLTIDRNTGWMHLLIERKGGDGWVWWVGEIAAWGLGPVHVATGAVGDTALALARHSDMVAVCGARKVETNDERDALAVLLRPGEQAEERLFDYQPGIELPHRFTETARDCKFSGDTLVLVGEAKGPHGEMDLTKRDRIAVLEVDVVAADDEKWTVAVPGPGTQSRALALDIDDLGRYHLAVYTCPDVCVPDGEVRVYEPGGDLAAQVQLGPLGSLWSGPSDIAWSPAGYAVVALGKQQGQSFLFEVQAVDPDEPEPVWTFTPKDTLGQQLGLAVAVARYGEVYAAGLADSHPAFAVIGG